MNDERAEDVSRDTHDPRGKLLWHELEDNVVEPSAQSPGVTLEGPGEPGEGTEPEDTDSREVIPGVLGGPPVIVTREDAEQEALPVHGRDAVRPAVGARGARGRAERL